MKEINSTSKYIKPARENKIFYAASVVFLFSLFILPQYFGIPFPMFDFTMLRIMIIVLLLMILGDRDRRNDFVKVITNYRYSLVLVPYLIVIGYTMVLRVDINAFLNPFLEIVAMYLLIYTVKYSLGLEKTINLIVGFTYVIAILGMVEFVIGRSPFSYLETISGIYTGQFIRSGHYRIMGPCNHSLGYGLMLVAITPISCIDIKEKNVNILKHPMLMILLLANVFFTGSRSTLSVFVVEIFLLFLFSSNIVKKKAILIFGIVLSVVAVYVIAFNQTSVAQYIMLQITTILDEIFGTELSVQYGASIAALSSSSNYREQLMSIFTLDWLNPFLGIGRKRAFASEINGSYIHSVDSFYIAEYIRYAYPGLFTYIMYLGYFIIGMVRRFKSEGGGIHKGLFAAVVCYLINLYWVDSLQTLKYLYIIFVIYIVFVGDEEKLKSFKLERNKIASRYIKKRFD